jgi:hypothetical protein
MDDQDLCGRAAAYLVRPDSDEQLMHRFFPTSAMGCGSVTSSISEPTFSADCFVVVFDGQFDASLILVDVLWDEMLDDFAPNGFVVAVPSKNALTFCDAETPEGPLQLHRIIKHLGGDHPISTSLCYRDPTHRDWRPYSL